MRMLRDDELVYPSGGITARDVGSAIGGALGSLAGAEVGGPVGAAVGGAMGALAGEAVGEAIGNAMSGQDDDTRTMIQTVMTATAVTDISNR
ncbi:glycine zipper domain-containing protein [Pseudomonas flavocrustae]|uniref:glycine zipper domain-containing protein n=1 Tax=Pseudomonas flavocrustae TaxID=2991719 RepID=UPI003D666C88